MSFRKKLFTPHKILGLVTGIVVFIVAITGCCWAFKDEILSFSEDYRTVQTESKPIITPLKARAIAQKIFPNNTVHGTIFKNSNNEVVEVIFYDADPEFYQSVYLNPYSGEIIKVNNHLSGFFAFVLKGHIRLWLPKAIGEHVVGISILLFLVIIISGFILWIPKKKKNLKQRITFDWKDTTRWKRKNFDLHTVIGFYVSSFALIIAFTGVVMSYNWMMYLLYKGTGGNKNIQFVIPKNTAEKHLDEKTLPIENLIIKLKQELPNADSYEVHYPHEDTESIYVEVFNSKGLYYNSDYRFYDQNSLKELEVDSAWGKYKNATFSEKIVKMNYDIHIGAIGGIIGKIIAFLTSLTIASLPVTGIILWYGRKYKKASK